MISGDFNYYLMHAEGPEIFGIYNTEGVLPLQPLFIHIMV